MCELMAAIMLLYRVIKVVTSIQ